MNAKAKKSPAVQFCDALVTNTTLQSAYVQTLVTASNSPSTASETFANFFNQQGFGNCTMNEVIAAQKRLPPYRLEYWQGTYQMTGSSTAAAGLLTIAVTPSKQVRVSVGPNSVRECTFRNLVLSWHGGPANGSTAYLMFNTTPASDDTPVNGFNGVLDGEDVDGTQVPPATAAPASPAPRKQSRAARIADDALAVASAYTGVYP